MKENFLLKKLQEREGQQALRRLRLPDGKVDFCSNDYLGIIHNGLIGKGMRLEGPDRIQKDGICVDGMRVDGIPGEGTQGNSTQGNSTQGNGMYGDGMQGDGLPGKVKPGNEQLGGGSGAHGSGGSRLLAGNYPLIEDTERLLAAFHDAPAGLIFNSGYDANLGLLSCVPQRGDTILYDQLSHASIRDGIRLSFARAFAFRHNDCSDLETRLKDAQGNIFVVTESVFSMDGDMAPLSEIAGLCRRYGANLIVDEAHGTGVIGPEGAGLVQDLGLADDCLARVYTFGKAVGCHGAFVAGSETLRDYLVNFARSFIYTTALPESSVQAIRMAYSLFPGMEAERRHLNGLIERFRSAEVAYERLDSRTPIQVVIVPGNEPVKRLAGSLQGSGLDIRPIMYPTVPAGSERLRIVLHAFNTVEEVDRLTSMLSEGKRI